MNVARALRLAVVSTLVLPLSAAAAVDAFLKIDGIQGESLDEKHRNEIVVESWSFGATSRSSESGASASRPCMSDISFVKLVDKASPLLLAAAVTGTHIGSAVLSVRKAGQGQQDYLVITMKEVLVSSVSQQQSSFGDGSVVPAEALSLNFASMTFSYIGQDDAGRALPAVQTTVRAKC